MTPNPLCGVYRQFQLENMEGYMAALGAGMMSRNMVLRSQVTLRITEVGTSSRLGSQAFLWVKFSRHFGHSSDEQ